MILVISGTSDGCTIAEKLTEKFDVIASVTTDYGVHILKEKGILTYKGKMNSNEIEIFIKENDVNLVIDASHPYAKNISQNAIKACKRINIDYIRYERPKDYSLDRKYFYSYDEAVKKLIKSEGNILITVGSNNLYRFMDKELINRVYVRILPTSNVLKMCENLGLNPNQIIAMKGPFTKEMNKLMIKEFAIKTLVTKESSKAGGFYEKVESAFESESDLIVISRPEIEYPIEKNDICELVKEVINNYQLSK